MFVYVKGRPEVERFAAPFRATQVAMVVRHRATREVVVMLSTARSTTAAGSSRWWGGEGSTNEGHGTSQRTFRGETAINNDRRVKNQSPPFTPEQQVRPSRWGYYR